MTRPLRLLMGYASLLHLSHMPWAMMVALIGAAVLSVVMLRLPGHLRSLAAPVYALAAPGLLLLAVDWWQGAFLVTVIAIVGWLKLGELTRARDGVLVWIAGLWTLAMAVLWLSPGEALLAAVPGIAIALYALARINGEIPVRAIVTQVFLALPLATILFVFTPRITGDLGVLAFALGIPLIIETEAEKMRDPMRDGLTMGEMANRASDTDMRVLVASFYGGSGKFYNGAPPLGDLYWRGPVLWTFEDGNWTGREGWQSRTQRMRGKITHETLDTELRETGLIAVYDVNLFPHRGHWLYALDFPAAVPPSTFITRDYQLQNLNPVREILNYPMMSYLDYRAGPRLDEQTRALALQFPNGANPQTRALGEELRAEHEDPVDIAKAGMAHFRGGFRYGKHFGGIDGADSVDRFLFQRRSGYAGHYATAFALVMRAAGVPSRIIAGYRGGVHLGLTNKVYVMENNAHAWTEIWLDQYGWVRMDPATVFARDGKAETDGWGLADGLGDAPEEKPEEDDREEQGEQGEAFDTADSDSFRTTSAPEKPEKPWWSRWVAELDARTQMTLLHELSLGGSWSNLIGLGGAFMAAFAGLWLSVRILWRAWLWRKMPPVDRLAVWAAGTLGGPSRRLNEGFRGFVMNRIAELPEARGVHGRIEMLAQEMSAALYADEPLAADWRDRWQATLEELTAARSEAASSS